MDDKRTSKEALSLQPRLGLRLSTLVAWLALASVKCVAKTGLLGPEKPTAAVQSPLAPAGCVRWLGPGPSKGACAS